MVLFPNELLMLVFLDPTATGYDYCGANYNCPEPCTTLVTARPLEAKTATEN